MQSKKRVYEKSLELARYYMAVTPKEEIESSLAEVKAMHIEGPTFNEYLGILQNELEGFMKKFKFKSNS
jgi:hypothetical protein